MHATIGNTSLVVDTIDGRVHIGGGACAGQLTTECLHLDLDVVLGLVGDGVELCPLCAVAIGRYLDARDAA